MKKQKPLGSYELPNGSVHQPSTPMEVNTMTIAQVTQPSKTDRPSLCTLHTPTCPAPDVSPGDTATARALRPPVPQRGPRPEHYRRIQLDGTETRADLLARGVPYMDTQFSRDAPGRTRQTQQEDREEPVRERPLAMEKERLRQVVEGAPTAFAPVAFVPRPVMVGAP